jgi:membrane protein implicated in regulation of membrane protease activity
MEMLWWHWILVGLVLAGLELLTPGGFFIVFFGAGGIVVGALALAGIAGPLWLQWLLFSVISVGALLLLRAPLQRRMAGSPRDVDALVGEVAFPTDDIAPGAVGRAELRGTTWNARNVDAVALARQQRCTVTRVDGLMIAIRAERAAGHVDAPASR